MTKMTYAGRTLMNFMSFNLGWWACALGPARGIPWLGPALMPLWLGLHFYYSPAAKGEAIFLAVLAAIGFSIDSTLLHLGLFSTFGHELFAPAWLISMWILFGVTFESMLMMRRNKWLVYLTGALSGPLSYYCGEALDVLHYHRPLWISLILHGALWCVLMPMLFKVRDFAMNLSGAKPILPQEPIRMAPPVWVFREEAPGVTASAHSPAAPIDPDKS